MAGFSFSIPDDFFNTIDKAMNIDNIAKKVIGNSAPILENAIKKESGKHNLTGEMTESIKTTKVDYNTKYGYYAVVRPTGKDRNGVRNMEKMLYSEYGFYNVRAQDQILPRPIMTKATNEVRQQVLDKMQKEYDAEVNGL